MSSLPIATRISMPTGSPSGWASSAIATLLPGASTSTQRSPPA